MVKYACVVQEDSYTGPDNHGFSCTEFVLCGAVVTSGMAIDRQQMDGQKTTREKYAAYLLSATYREHGYYGAKVEIKQAGTKRLFIVDPGQIFHVKEVLVTGLQTFPEDKILWDAPKPGDIDSAARTNEWIQGLVKSYVENDGPLKLVNWGAKYDHAHAQVTIQLMLQERR